MAEPVLTSEQRTAVTAVGSAAIRAGAGSGKTAVLAHRFLELLSPAAGGARVADDVGQILAITFTEKAAAEMRARIRLLVGEALGRATETERPRWERIRRELLGAQISTIHAFCARIVRENPLEAGIDPQAVVLDEHESRAWSEGIVEEVIVGRLRDGDPAARELLLARRGLRGRRDGGAVGLCVKFLARLAVSGRDGAWLTAALARQEARVPAAVAALAADVARIRSVVAERLARGGNGKGFQALRDEWGTADAFLAGFDAGAPPAALDRLSEVAKLIKGAKIDALAPLLRVDAGGRGRPAGSLAEEYGFLVSLPHARALTALVAEAFAAVERRKRIDAVLTFDDLISEARALLARHPAVLRRYATRFRAVLVDEFQDTDAVQGEVIAQLAAAGATLFIVGDEKQSIYRFRGADVAVFQRVRRELVHQLPLGTNFRSQPAILEFVNGLAARTLKAPAGDGDHAHWTLFEPADRLVPDREQTWPRPGVRLVSFAGMATKKQLRAAEAREIEGRVLAEVIAGLRARPEPAVRYGDVAVLFRSLNQVKAYEYALRRREIPYYVVKGRGFFQCQEVRDVASLLATVADPGDDVALAAALRSPFFAVDDDLLWRLAWPDAAEKPGLGRRFRSRRETFADLPADAPRLGRIRDLLVRLRHMRSRATIAELIEEALAATDFEPVLLTQFQGQQKVANVRKLIELARVAERRRYFGLRDFVRLVRELTEREPREPEAQLVGEQDDVVRLMTIHQAKGLEFPVVILVDLVRQLDRDNTPVVLDDELGILVSPVEGAGAFALRHARLQEWRAREEDRTRAEQARLLYVACTRARDELVLLEGRPSTKYLTTGEGDPYRWCHQIWDLLGRDRVQEFVASGATEETLPLPGGGEVLVQRAETYAARTPAPSATIPEPAEAPPTDVEERAVRRVLDFVPPPATEVVTSPTALGDFRRCPRQYWFRHVLGVVERAGGGERARLRGTAAHAVLETISLDGATDDDVDRRLAATPEVLALDAKDVDALRRDLRATAAMLRREVAGGLEIVGREVPFVLPLPAGRPTLFVEGRIDLLARRDGVFVVRDYKYAAPSAGSAEQYAAQLAAYRLAVAAGGDRVDAELIFLRDGPRVVKLPPLDAAQEATALEAAGRALGAALARGDEASFVRTPTEPATCEALGCGYVGRCWGSSV